MDWPPAGIDFNTKKLEKYHHMIQYVVPDENKVVKVCRCWQSKRFPYCDDTHKVLIEAGDNVGPYVAKINGKPPQAQNVGATNSFRMRGQLPKNVAFFALGFGTVGLACALASSKAKGKLQLGLNLGRPAGDEATPQTV
mmetsp:Transcript_62828/g.149859  ORF Transcript_62828/g.149859 Transcript_62828/m.149859 type:complete len:139 (+) Transcript_62828:99-515(+)